MNIDFKQLPIYFKKAINYLKKYLIVIFAIFVVAINGFLILKINQLGSQEPLPEQVQEQQNAIKRINIDQESIDKIQSLEERNIAVQSLFKDARDNPFSDN